MKFLFGVLVGTILDLYLGCQLGVGFERCYVTEWKATSFFCVDELVKCDHGLKTRTRCRT